MAFRGELLAGHLCGRPLPCLAGRRLGGDAYEVSPERSAKIAYAVGPRQPFEHKGLGIYRGLRER